MYKSICDIFIFDLLLYANLQLAYFSKRKTVYHWFVIILRYNLKIEPLSSFRKGMSDMLLLPIDKDTVSTVLHVSCTMLRLLMAPTSCYYQILTTQFTPAW